MPMIEIPEELDIVLEDAASRAGRSKGDLAQEILAARLDDESLPLSAFTEAQLERMQESVAQIGRGEVYSSEHVDRMFEDWRQRRAAH